MVERTAILMCSLLLFVGAASAQLTPADSDFIVNSYTTGEQKAADVVHLTGGGFVVVWEGLTLGDPSNSGIAAQLLDDGGAFVGAEIAVNSDTDGVQREPSASAAPDGGFVAVWRGGGDKEIRARRFDATASALGPEFVVTASTYILYAPAVGHSATGEFIVVWQAGNFGHGPDGDGGAILARRFDSAGVPAGTEFQVNTYTTDDQERPHIAVADDGSFAVAWTTDVFTHESDVMARMFDSSGNGLGADFIVNVSTTRRQQDARVARLLGGDYVVSWENSSSTGGRNARLRLFDSTGAAVTGELTADEGVGFVASPDVSASPDGSFLVVWGGRGPDDPVGVWARHFDASANPTGPQQRINANHMMAAAPLALAHDGGGSALVAWTNPSLRGSEVGSDGSNRAVAARRLCAAGDGDCEICTGFDDALDGDGDGIPNGCDACTPVPGASSIDVKPKLRISNDATPNIPKKSNRLALGGELTLPGPPGAFADLDLETTGARVRIEGATGGTLSDTLLPAGAFAGGAGWKSNGAGTKWIFRNKGGAAPGRIQTMKVIDRSKKAPNRVRVSAKGRAGQNPLDASFLPAQAIVTLGDFVAADLGICGESHFDAADCNYVVGINPPRLSCSR